MQRLKYAKLIPGGNTTIIIFDQVPRKHQALLARTIMEQHSDCEQVGFVEPASGNSKAICRLQMMGGEFCGNATRCLTWLVAGHYLHHGDTCNAEIKNQLFGSVCRSSGSTTGDNEDTNNQQVLAMEVSGAGYILEAKYLIDSSGKVDDVIVPMPIRFVPADCLKQSQLFWNENEMTVTIVHLDGISHVIVDSNRFSEIGGDPGNLLETKHILASFGLEQLEAAGVIFTRQVGDSVAIVPVVYVRETDTLILETACGSGTVALAQKIAFEKGESVFVKIIQPSGETIAARVEMLNGMFESASIMGKVNICEEGVISIPNEDNPLAKVELQQIKRPEELEPYADQVGSLYARVFADAPYYERFTPEEGYGYLLEIAAANHGLLFLAFDGDDVVGFGGGLPLTYDSDICKVVNGCLKQERAFYIAELGVDHCYRGLGLSHELINSCHRAIDQEQFDQVLVRTSVANNATLHLFRDRRDFSVIANVRQQVVNRKFLPGATEPQDVPDERLFLVRTVKSAKQNLAT